MNIYLETAEKAARTASDIQQKYWLEGFEIDSKSNVHDRVTSADRDSEKAIIEIIGRAFPGHGFLGEESGITEGSAEYLWVIDPLDGTSNYSKMNPFFAVSIALYQNGRPLCGLVYHRHCNELFTAVAGEGAFLNGNALKVSRCTTLHNALLATGFSYDRKQHTSRNLGHIENAFDRGILGIRRSGSAALDLCYVAAGRLDGYFELELFPWDYAAGRILIEEAGGTITSLGNKPLSLEKTGIISSNSMIHGEMADLLNPR